MTMHDECTYAIWRKICTFLPETDRFFFILAYKIGVYMHIIIIIYNCNIIQDRRHNEPNKPNSAESLTVNSSCTSWIHGRHRMYVADTVHVRVQYMTWESVYACSLPILIKEASTGLRWMLEMKASTANRLQLGMHAYGPIVVHCRLPFPWNYTTCVYLHWVLDTRACVLLVFLQETIARPMHIYGVPILHNTI